MSATPRTDDAYDFVWQVVKTGIMLFDVLSMLLDDVPDDAFSGEEPGQVLIQMLAGTFAPAAQAAGLATVREATALVGALGDRRYRTFAPRGTLRELGKRLLGGSCVDSSTPCVTVGACQRRFGCETCPTL